MNYLMKIKSDFGIKRDVAVVSMQNSFKLNLQSIAHCVQTDKDPLEMIGAIDKKYIHYNYSISKKDNNIHIDLANTFEGFVVNGKYFELIFNPGSRQKITSAYGEIFAYRYRHTPFDAEFNASPTLSYSFANSWHCDIFEEVPFSLESSLYKLHHNKKEEHKQIVYNAYKEIRAKEINEEIKKLTEELKKLEDITMTYSGKVVL